MPIDVLDAFIAKKWLNCLYVFLRTQGPRLGIHYALNPEEQAQLSLDLQDSYAVAMDIVHQDGSHETAMWITLFKLFIKCKLFHNLPRDAADVPKTMHPDLEDLYYNCRVWYGIFRNNMDGLLILFRLLFMISGTLKSGLGITTPFNCISNWAMAELYCKEMRDQFGLKLRHEVFGDDVTICMPKKPDAHTEKQIIGWAQIVWGGYGYQLSGAVKDQPMRVTKYMETALCGRKLNCLVAPGFGPTWTKSLEVDRIVKAVCYTKGGEVNDYAMTLCNGLVEMTRCGEETFDVLMSCMVWENGSQLTHYVGDWRRVWSHWRGGTLHDIENACRAWIATAHLGTLPVAYDQMDHPASILKEGPFAPSQIEVNAGEELLAFTVDSQLNVAQTQKHDKLQKFVAPFLYEAPVLNRELFLGALTVDTTAAVNDIVWAEAFPSAYFNAANKAQAEIWDTASFTYDYLVIRVVPMGSPFQKMAIILGGAPMARTPSDFYEATTGPHVIASVSSAEDAILRVPFNRDLFYHDSPSYGTTYASQYFDNVNIWVMILSPVDSPTQTTVEFMIYARFEKALFLESATTNFTVGPPPFPSHQGERESLVPGQVPTAPEVPTANGTQTTNITNAPFSGWSLKAAIPGPGVLCKPVPPVTMSLIRNGPGACNANCFGGDFVQHLGTGPESKGVPPVGLCGGVDHMAFDVIAALPSVIKVVNWINTDAVGTKLYSSAVTPCVLKADAPGTTIVANCAFAASFFQYYRCDMVYKLFFVKPMAAAGAIQVTVDYGQATSFVSDILETGALYRTVIDIKKGDGAVSIRVPYIHPTPFKKVVGMASTDAGDGPTIEITTITKLTTNSNVSSSVDLVIYASAENFIGLWPTDHAHPLMQDALSAVEPGPEAAHRRESKGKEREEVRSAPVLTKFADHQVDASRGSEAAAMFVPSSMQFASAPFVHLGPEMSRFQRLDHETIATYFGGGDYISSFQQLFKRRVIAREYLAAGNSGELNIIFDPNNADHYPIYMTAAFQAFIFGYGGFRVTVVDINQVKNGIAVATNINSSGTLAANMRQLDPMSLTLPTDAILVEAEVENVGMYPIYVLGNPAAWDLLVKSNQQGSGTRYICVGASDSFRVFGKNYNTARSILPFANQGVNYVTAVPATLEAV